MKEEDKKIVEWFKNRWLAHQHGITVDLINEASSLFNEDYNIKDRWNFDTTVKLIHKKGLDLVYQLEWENDHPFDVKSAEELLKSEDNFLQHDDFDHNQIIEVDEDTLNELSKSSSVEFKKKKNKK